MAKQEGRKLNLKSLEALCPMTVRLLVEHGEQLSEAIRSPGLCRTSSYSLLRTQQKKSLAAQLLCKCTVRQSKFNIMHRQQVRGWILGKESRQRSVNFAFLTRPTVAQFIDENFAIHLKTTAVERQLAGLKITPQNPERVQSAEAQKCYAQLGRR